MELEEINVISSLYRLGQQKATSQEIANEILLQIKSVQNDLQMNSFMYAIWMSLQRIRNNYRVEDYLDIINRLSLLDDRLTKPIIYMICVRVYLYERDLVGMQRLYDRAVTQTLGPEILKTIRIGILWLQLRNPVKYETAESELNELLEV